MKKKLFIDSDGTLFEWNKTATLDDLVAPGYYAEQIPQYNVVEGIKMFKNKHPEVEVYIATCVLNYPHVVLDKKKSFKKHLNFIKQNHIIYIPYGVSKAEFIGDVDEECYLVDDYTPNLFDWENHNGRALKLRNDVNGTKNRWQKDYIHSDYPAWMICEGIERFMNIDKSHK